VLLCEDGLASGDSSVSLFRPRNEPNCLFLEMERAQRYGMRKGTQYIMVK
jgi:hypothetical protein